MSSERAIQPVQQIPARGPAFRARSIAALVVVLTLAVFSTRARAVPPNLMVPPTGQPARDGVQTTSHTEMVPADRAFAGSQPPAAARRAAPPPAPVPEQKTRLAAQNSTPARTGATSGGIKQLLATGASLAVVLGLFAGVVWMMRRGMPKGLAQRLPSDVLDVLGQATLAHRQQVQLVRLGQKLLLINVSPNGAETLAEVTDPAEVDRLSALCRGGAARGAATSFRDVLQQFRGPAVATATAATKPRMPGLVGSKGEVTDG